MFSFNLIDEKWIPCLMVSNGKKEELSIKETLFRSQEIKEICDTSPLVTVTLHRLLLAVLHRNFGPANEEDWGELWKNGDGCFDQAKLGNYMATWRNRFNLFDDKYPFYQCASMPVSITDSKNIEKPYFKSVANIRHELVAGNNATLFDHSLDTQPQSVSPPEAARLLVTFQAFAIGGLLTLEAGQNPKLFKSADNAPLVKGAVTLVQGTTLFQTLLLNLHKYNRLDAEPFKLELDDAPIWERSEETQALDRYPKGYLDLLTWQSRRVLLIPERNSQGDCFVNTVVIMKGNQFPEGYSLHGKESMLSFRKVTKPNKGQDPWPALAFHEDRAIWRSSLSLFQSVAETSTKPKTLNWLYELSEAGKISWNTTLNLALSGLVSDRASISLWRHERLPLPLAYLAEKNENLLGALKDALNLAEDVGRLLGSGFIKIEIEDKQGKKIDKSVPSPLYLLASNILKPEQPENADKDTVKSLIESLSTSRPYWAQLGISFNDLLFNLPNDKNGDEYGQEEIPKWATEIRHAAMDAFSETIGSFDRTARMLKAATIAESEFRHHLYEILEPYMEIK